MAAMTATANRIHGHTGVEDAAGAGEVVAVGTGVTEAGQILITQRLHAEVEEDVEVEPIGELTLKGFRTPTPAFNVIAVREPVADASALQGP
jgi:class 3 adenylate cyclase